MNDFNKFILDNKVIGFFNDPITLKSGRKSHFYVNWRDATNDAFLLDKLTDFIVEFLDQKGIECDSIYGVPEGATKSAIIASMKLAKRSKSFEKGSHIISIGRAKPKEHGDPKDRLFIGVPKGKILVLEDTTTTGGSLISTLDTLLDLGINVTHAVGLTDRMEKRDDGTSVAEYIQNKYKGSIKYLSMSNALELLPEAKTLYKVDPKVLKELNKEFSEYGVKPLNLE